MKTMSTVLGVMTLASTWIAGALGVIVVATLGPWLAMGARMYGGDTEPRHPEVVLPWVWIVVTALLPVPLAARRHWHWASAAALPFALLPWWLLVKLYAAAAG